MNKTMVPQEKIFSMLKRKPLQNGSVFQKLAAYGNPGLIILYKCSETELTMISGYEGKSHHRQVASTMTCMLLPALYASQRE